MNPEIIMKRREFIRDTAVAASIALVPPAATPFSDTAHAVEDADLQPPANRGKTGELYAGYVHAARFEDLPNEVREKAKELILDSVGCALGGTQTQEGKGSLRLAKELTGGGAESTVIGGGTQIAPDKAAFVNAQLANVLDFDDTYDVYAPGHLGCLIVPSALAVGEAVHASGRDVLVAVVLGYEITMRVGRAMGTINWLGGQPMIPSVIGPAVVTARLLRMDEAAVAQTLNVLTLEIGGVSRVVQQKWDVPATMNLGTLKGNYGQQAELGIMAAYKAKSGLTGMKGVLDADFTGWYSYGLPAQGFQYLTRGLGREYWTLEMSLKPTPSCRWTHPPITAAWTALEHRPLSAADVSKVVVKGVNRLERYKWESMLDAQFSMPCALALALTGVTSGPEWYVTGRFKDADIRELGSKVRLERDPEAEWREIMDLGMTCTVEITFSNGQVKIGRCDHVKGAPKNPLTREELLAKFKANASHLSAASQQQIIDKVLNLEETSDIRSLMAMLG
jgi:2-methylcitrate dehydratase PrpD